MNPGLVWNIPVEKEEKTLFLTFDDGPHPIATRFVLDTLKQYNALATFFCVGRNVADHKDIFQDVINDGHSIGNHTHNHLNGWKVSDREYIDDVLQAAAVMDTSLFRPPYGRITRFQSRVLRGKADGAIVSPGKRKTFSIIMWSVLSGDWDHRLTGERCYDNVVLNARPGSIIVFHDSAKALDRLQFALPKVLEHFSSKGYRFAAITPGLVSSGMPPMSPAL